MLVKDGANAQIYVEAGKNYRLSFYYYIPDTEADYALNYWFAAADNENRFDYASNSIATARLVETSIADPIKGQWTLVTVNVKNAAYSGKLRLGLCASTASAANRYTFYIDDIGVVECADFIPDPEVEAKRQREILSGDVPSPVNLPKGCCFCKRCPKAMDICKEVKPQPREIAPGHLVACHLCGGDQV